VNIVDNLSWARGGHQLKFGADYRWLAPISIPVTYRQFVQFSAGLATAAGGARSGMATTVATQSRADNALLTQNFSFYGQDTWKITPRFTVTYGLRWDINPPLKGKTAANDPFALLNLDNPSAIALAPRGTPLYQTTYGNVAPRFGM